MADVVGGGTIDRKGLANALFNGKALDELPPIVVVVKDGETGLYHVLKTALASDAGSETTYKVAKNHLFGVGDFVTIGGLLSGASDKITAIDKSNADYDVITVEATIGSATKGQVGLLKSSGKVGSQYAVIYDTIPPGEWLFYYLKTITPWWFHRVQEGLNIKLEDVENIPLHYF